MFTYFCKTSNLKKKTKPKQRKQPNKQKQTNPLPPKKKKNYHKLAKNANCVPCHLSVLLQQSKRNIYSTTLSYAALEPEENQHCYVIVQPLKILFWGNLTARTLFMGLCSLEIDAQGTEKLFRFLCCAFYSLHIKSYLFMLAGLFCNIFVVSCSVKYTWVFSGQIKTKRLKIHRRLYFIPKILCL